MSQHEEHHHGIQVDEMKREACGYGVGVSDGEIDSPFGHRPPSRGERRMGSGALLTLIACGLALASAAKAATFLVSKTADTNDGTCDADCSLREAVIAANAAAGADTIVVPTGTFLLTIPDADEDFAANGDLDIRDELALNGLGTAATIVDGNNATRVFHLLTNTPVSIRDLAIRNASTSGFGAAIHHTGAGAVTLSNLVVTDNVAGGFGGAINNNSVGTISIQTSTISRNTTQGSSFGAASTTTGPAASASRTPWCRRTLRAAGAAASTTTGPAPSASQAPSCRTTMRPAGAEGSTTMTTEP
jgi:CSLREA domain-containing protein